MLQRLLPGRLGSPLRIRLDFEDRPYRLQDSIDVMVELDPRRDLEVIEGRVDLVCEQRYTMTHVRYVSIGRPPGVLRQGPPSPITHPKREIHEYTEEYPHSSFEFANSAPLRAKVKSQYRIRLKIDLKPPPHTEGTLKWSLTATCELGDEQSVSESRSVTVTLPD